MIAMDGFTEVADSNGFHDDINAVKDAGVTLGCGDGTAYCPNDNVTRGQMAAFMNRLGALEAGTTPVVNAAQLEGFSAAGLGSRAAFSSSADLPDADGTPLSTVIVTPVDGILIINADVGWGRNDATEDNILCRIKINGDDLTGSLMTDGVRTTTLSRDICSTGGAIAVVAGAHSIILDVADIAAGTFLFEGYLNVLWVPFNAIGDTPLIVP